MLPNFLVLGAAKAGTTTLCHLLSQHPDVYLSPRKELHYFSFDAVHRHGLKWYRSWFETAGSARAVGEASTTYTLRKLFPQAPDRISETLPNARLIYLVRHPVDRMESVWMQLRRFGANSPFADLGVSGVPAGMRVERSFNKAVLAQSDVIIESTNYRREIEPYRDRFPEERILVLQFERFIHDPVDTLRTCFQFLGVAPSSMPSTAAVHLNAAREALHPRDFLWRLWSVPGLRHLYATLSRAAPSGVRHRLGRVLRQRRETTRPKWDPIVLNAALDRLEPDLIEFLRESGLPEDAWSGFPRVRIGPRRTP
jgi:hypothetical protein